eukprot:symbB.v1.2.019451.t1/scaffold1592.1/size133026/1
MQVDELIVEAIGEESSSESEPEETEAGTAQNADTRKGAAGVADEVKPRTANSKAASRPRDRGSDFSFSALAKRKQEERLQAEKLKKDEERAKRKEEQKRKQEEGERSSQITEEQKLKLNELKKKQDEIRRQKLREKLEAKQQRAKEREQKRAHLEEQQRSQKERAGSLK